jgi:anionic cell wall polymer biosynthesis LytR-Cps2A-Psr (LCP) family protein
MTGKRRMGRDDGPPKPVSPPPVAQPVAPPVVMAPRVTRRQARLARRREQRRRVGVAGGVAIAAIGLIIVAGLAFGVHKVVTHHDGSKRTQTTVLLQLRGTHGGAAASVLLAHDPATKSGVEVLVPTRVITDVCGFGSQNFGNVLALPNGVAASQQAMSAMLNNITVDGSWVITPAQFAKLIDALGGITIDHVDVNVVHRTAGGGGQILIPAGANRKLNGTQAMEYALYTASPSESAAAELARLHQVVDTTIQALPTSPTAIAALLRQLGPGGTSTLGSTRLAALLAGLASDDRSSAGVLPTDLPVTEIDAGGTSPSYRIDDAATGVPQLVNTQLANSLPPDADRHRPSVLLLNGVGTPGLVLTACPRLAAHGYAYGGSNNAASFNNPRSSVQIRSDADVSLGDGVARALGLPTSDVEISRTDQSVADVIVVLGGDYRG